MTTTTIRTAYPSTYSIEQLANILANSDNWKLYTDYSFKGEVENNSILDSIQDVFFNEEKGTTTVKWKDNTITTVFCDEDDYYDKEKGLAMCVMKYFFGNDGRFNQIIKAFVPEVEYAIKTENEYKIYNYRNAKAAAKKLKKPLKYILNKCEEDKEMNFIYDV